MMFLQEKSFKATDEWLKDKGRFAILGNLEIAAGNHKDPIKNFCTTMGQMALKFIIAMAAYCIWVLSKSYFKQAFQ